MTGIVDIERDFGELLCSKRKPHALYAHGNEAEGMPIQLDDDEDYRKPAT
jgi:hypothetical protein